MIFIKFLILNTNYSMKKISLQKLQRQLEFLEVQEEYIKDEQKNLKKEYLHAQEEVKRIQSVPLVIGQFLEAVDQNTGIVGSTTGKQETLYFLIDFMKSFYCRIFKGIGNPSLNTIDLFGFCKIR